MLTAPFEVILVDSCMADISGATVFLLEIRKSPRAESIQLVEKLRGEGGGSAVHVHLWARCTEFVNQHFLILIITNKMGAFKEQRDSCFTRLNEQAERCKKKKKKKKKMFMQRQTKLLNQKWPRIKWSHLLHKIKAC